MLRLSIIALSAALLLCLGHTAAADVEEPPLKVAPSGSDAGSCLDNPCRSLDFALRRVGKNGRIVVAAGHYELRDPGDIFYLVSGATGVELFRADGGRAGEMLGFSVRDAGDVDGDGTPDVVAGGQGTAGVAGAASTAAWICSWVRERPSAIASTKRA